MSGSATLRVTLYSKPQGCSLCDVVKEQLARLARDLPLEVEEIDIRSDPELFARYRYEIPVVLLEGRKAAKYRLDEAAFRRRCEALLARLPA